jgi:DNA helicase-2/ATP-dependent DNA helicase PcrA
MNFEDRYQRLNDAQKQAVDTTEGPVLVVAGPGAGKTELLSLRVANILRQHDVNPQNILCLTFTENAAMNMRKRLASMIGADAYRVAIHTFHSFGSEIIQNYPEYFFQGVQFTPVDEVTSREILEEIFTDLSVESPLNSTGPDGEFVYLSDVSKGIDALKKAGLSPDEFERILEHNAKSVTSLNAELGEIFAKRMSKKLIPEYYTVLETLKRDEFAQGFPHEYFRPLSTTLALTLEEPYALAETEQSQKPLSPWKKAYVRKFDTGEHGFKETKYLEKLQELCRIYRAYQEELSQQGYFDFQDMIVETIEKVRSQDSLKSELQEQYQFLLVDEFQDTNDAQMSLLYLLTENDTTPNIMAVGDDDQGIFKFQGAEISNILSFTERFEGAKVITLTKNYRSTADILGLARTLIIQGKERLENKLEYLEKDLEAAGTFHEDGQLVYHQLTTQEEEYSWIATRIEKLLDSHVDASEIAVICRGHKFLQGLVPYLLAKHIPIKYSKQQDLLQEQPIIEILTIARFVESLRTTPHAPAEELLPEILSYPFFVIDRVKIWEMSVNREERSWMKKMLTSDDQKVVAIAKWLIELSQRAEHEPMSMILDRIVGGEDPISGDESVGFTSPLKDYYLSTQNFTENQALYMSFLTSLKSFIEKVTEYRKGRFTTLADMLSYVDLHARQGGLLYTSPYQNADVAVELLTAHASKGLEYEHVFVMETHKSVWMSKGKNDTLPFPSNLPIKPGNNGFDDHLRLFFVAITRAKTHLYLSTHQFDQSGKELEELPFLAGADADKKPEKSSQEFKPLEVLLTDWESRHAPPFAGVEESHLFPLVKDYKMSASVLNDFVNVHKGPQHVLEYRLLRFPTPKLAVSAFGTAVHGTVQAIYAHLKRSQTLPDLVWVQETFRILLEKEQLLPADYEKYLYRGKNLWDVYVPEKLSEFAEDHLSEISFASQGVQIGEAKLSGKIDRIILSGDTAEVTDFKTAKAVKSWDIKGKKDQLDSYARQLMFYKILIERSRDYGDYKVFKGDLEYMEPVNGQFVSLPLYFEDEDVKKLERLIEVVYDKIVNLEFPDVTPYQSMQDGTDRFIEDLLEGKV